MFIPHLDKLSYRDVIIHSPLRPDFYEWWPNFSDFELLSRTDCYGFYFATQLSLRNMERLLELNPVSTKYIKSFLMMHHDTQREILSSIIKRTGIHQKISDAFGAIPRSNFIVNKYASLAYTNITIPFSNGSWISMPGLIAVMIQTILGLKFDTVVEIGAGSGYHLALMRHVFGKNIVITGYETNVDYAKFGNNALRRSGIHDIEIVPEMFDTRLLSQKNTMFIFTCTASRDTTLSIYNSIHETSFAQIPHHTFDFYQIEEKYIPAIDTSKFHTISLLSPKNSDNNFIYPLVHDVSFVEHLTESKSFCGQIESPRLNNLLVNCRGG